MFMLYVSTNSGFDYAAMDVGQDLEVLRQKTLPFEGTGRRWYIQDMASKILVDYCEVFKTTLETMLKVGESSPVAFSTEDLVLASLLREYGVHVFSSYNMSYQSEDAPARRSSLH